MNKLIFLLLSNKDYECQNYSTKEKLIYSLKDFVEEKKILFYYPAEVDGDTKVKDIGLSEAIIKFTNTFTKDDSCQSVHTQKTSHLYYQAERDFWMVMTLNVPYEVKTKEKFQYNEYRGDDVQDSVYKSVLKQSYKMFRLFMGTFISHFTGDTMNSKSENLVTKLQNFYSKYVLTLKLQNSDILDVFQSIQYLPLNQFLFLRVHNFMKMIESTFPIIKHTIFLYNDQVIWSGINPTDLYSIYEYLVSTLFPKNLSSELKGGSMPKRNSFWAIQYGGFITASECFENCVKSPKMYVFTNGQSKEYYLIVYKALSGVVCLFADSCDNLSEEFYQEIQSFVGPQLSNIASEINEHFNLQSSTSALYGTVSQNSNGGPKYLYFNEFMLQHQGTVHIGNRCLKTSNVQNNIMHLVTDLYDVRITKNLSEETIIKTLNDFWIVKKHSNSRYFFVIINKSSTLLEISEDSKKIYDQYIKNVFFDK